MLTVTLAGTGSQLVFPTGTSVEDSESKDKVLIKDGAGQTLAIIQRRDVAIYSTDPQGFRGLEDLELSGRGDS